MQRFLLPQDSFILLTQRVALGPHFAPPTLLMAAPMAGETVAQLLVRRLRELGCRTVHGACPCQRWRMAVGCLIASLRARSR